MNLNHPAILLTCLVVFGAGCGSEDTSAKKASDPPVPEVSQEDRAILQALGYINTVPGAKKDGSRFGVMLHDRARAFAGLNLFNHRDQITALLMDMEGKIRHRWSSQLKGEIYRQMKDRYSQFMPSYLEGWNLVTLLPDGDLLVIGAHHMVLRLDCLVLRGDPSQ